MARVMVSRNGGAKEPVRFVVDAMLANVARDLRLLGYDAAYFRDAEDLRLLRIAQSEERVLVTRDRALAARAGGLPSVLVTAEEPENQAAEVLRALGLAPDRDEAYSRCLTCNHRLESAPRDEAAALVPDHVATAAEGFLRCPSCRRVYWRGSHATRLNARVDEILASLHPGEGRL
jgi:uncharacterized protein with PIN domain